MCLLHNSLHALLSVRMYVLALLCDCITNNLNERLGVSSTIELRGFVIAKFHTQLDALSG
jgi:hypothetical protein